MTSHPGKQIMAKHILPNISRRNLKANQTMKLALLKNHSQNVVNLYSLTIFEKIEHISGSIVQSFIQFVLLHAKLSALETY